MLFVHSDVIYKCHTYCVSLWHINHIQNVVVLILIRKKQRKHFLVVMHEARGIAVHCCTAEITHEAIVTRCIGALLMNTTASPVRSKWKHRLDLGIPYQTVPYCTLNGNGASVNLHGAPPAACQLWRLLPLDLSFLSKLQSSFKNKEPQRPIR